MALVDSFVVCGSRSSRCSLGNSEAERNGVLRWVESMAGGGLWCSGPPSLSRSPCRRVLRYGVEKILAYERFELLDRETGEACGKLFRVKT